ncbi:unnamed protein product [Cunninghamella blakesleeana]
MTNATIQNTIATNNDSDSSKINEYKDKEGSQYFTCNSPTTSISNSLATKRTVSEVENSELVSSLEATDLGGRKYSKINNDNQRKLSVSITTAKTTMFKTENSDNDNDDDNHKNGNNQLLTAKINHSPSNSDDHSSIKNGLIKKSTFEPDLPEWDKYNKAWAFLQSLNPMYKSKYLERQGVEGEKGAGYVFGRDQGCDFRFNKTEVSRRHCYIYMERGCNDIYGRGISIYLEDISTNGTFINGEKIEKKERKLLRSGDRIQLYRIEQYPDDDTRHSFYRVIFPPTFEVIPFHNEYQVCGEVGRGNFATVFKGFNKSYDKSTEKKYIAAKVIAKSKFQRKPKLLPSVLQEIGILMSLEVHPCVIQIEKVFDESRYIYLVLEYIREGDLFDFVSTRKVLTEDETRFIYFQLFSGIEFLHQRGVVHRDLKPENVLMVDRTNLRVKITDFGLATYIKSDLLDTQCGTPNYVAPEILSPSSTRSYGKPCDLWSLGVILYICLCGFPPFNEDMGPPNMKTQIMNGIYSFPSPYWDGISEEAKDLVSRLLTVDPKERITLRDAKSHMWMIMNNDDLQRRLSALPSNEQQQFEFFSSTASLEPTQLS